MNRITLTITGILLATGAFATATVAYAADKGDKRESSQAVSHESSREGKQDASDDDKRNSSGEQDRDKDSRHMSNGTSRDVKLSNLSHQRIEHIHVEFSGKDAEDFRQKNDCGDKLDGGASCTISVIFQPHSKGDKSATMEVHSSGGDESVDLAGTGT